MKNTELSNIISRKREPIASLHNFLCNFADTLEIASNQINSNTILIKICQGFTEV